jgi:hypothetical protein
LGLAPQRVTNHPGNPHQKLLGGTKRMKKFLVLFVSAALVLSMAAVSLAAVTVAGDFRYDMYQDESVKAGEDESYAETALYYSVAGDVSDSVYAFAKFKVSQKSTTTDDSWTTVVDEFYASVKQPWGVAKMGYFEYKFTPSRNELKSAGTHVFPKTDANFLVSVPVAEGFTVDGLVAPYKHEKNKVDDGAYALGITYAAENWGAKVSYADFAHDDLGDLTAIDAYYMLNDDMKVFVDAVDYSKADSKYKDGYDPVLGFKWTNIAESPLEAAVEYAINKRNDGDPNEYSEYVLTAGYKLSNNIILKLYHFVTGDDDTKDKFRIQYKF